MTTLEFLSYLNTLDIKVWVEGDRLHYNSPAGAMTAELRQELSARKPDILSLFHKATAAASAGPPALRSVARPADIPLSFAQQRFWFLDQLLPDRATYTIATALRIHGQLDRAALQASFDRLVERHESLRTHFRLSQLDPVQQIDPPGPHLIRSSDLRAVSELDRPAVLQETISTLLHEPFILQSGPLLRTWLIRVADTEFVLLVQLHHSIADGWSLSVLVRDLLAFYQSYRSEQPVGLPELPVQYADYALWQRQWLAGHPQGMAHGAVMDRQLDYWKRQLAGAPPLELPTDHPRPLVSRYHSSRMIFQLPTAMTVALQALSRRLDVTLFMTLLAAFQTLLARYSGQIDIIVGTPIAGRVRPELEDLIGCFVNTLVLRTNLGGRPRFADLLARVRTVCLDAYAHQDLPFELLVDQLQPERDLSRSPLFQVMFALQNIPQTAINVPGLTFEVLDVESTSAKFDLSLTLNETAEGLQGVFEYSTDLFDATTISRLAAHFQSVVTAVVADPDQHIDCLPLLTEAERHTLLVDWNASQADYPQDTYVHQLIAAQAARTPHRVALVSGVERLTYAELDRRANQLAHQLQALGVGKHRRGEELVGIYMERTPAMVIGVLGVLKAGGAYLPLAPTDPADRLAFALADAHVRVLLTQTRLLGQLPAHQAPTLCLDADWSQIAHNSPTCPITSIEPEHVAYVIYTSGSTGRPKGVQVPHRALVNFLHSMRQQPGLSMSDTLLAVTTLSFDIAGLELFLPLMVGAQVVLARHDEASDGMALAGLLERSGATVMQATPASWRLLLETGWLPPARFKILCGGEALPRDLARRLLTNDSSLWNLYGPTETTIWSSLEQVISTEARITIGRPIKNTQLHLLDRQLQPVPIGVTGELYIGGAGLARGYLNRPELTAERFLPNPFSGHGTRLYRTGDLARYLADGRIEHLGRTDHQIKLRGYRIELGEIEQTLRQHVAVRETVVVLRDERLVAYVVPQKRAAPDALGVSKEHVDTIQLRNDIKTRLPEYMIPSVIVVLDAFPLTPSGKVDRRALPAPELDRSILASTVVPARNHLEWQLAQIWTSLLNVYPVGVTDSFFALGGHSLLAVRLMAQIQERFGQRLPLATLFLAPTIEQLAARLRRSEIPIPWSPLVALQPNGPRRPFFCVHPAGGTVLCYAELARLLGTDQPFYALQARGLEPGQTPIADIPAMAESYLQALRSVQPYGPYLLGGWSLGGSIAFEMARQLRAQAEQVDLLVLIDSDAPAPHAPPIGDTELLAGFANDLGGLFGQALTITPLELGQLDTGARLEYILTQARERAIVPADLDTHELRRLAQVFQTHIRALLRYDPPATPVHIDLFQASDSDNMAEPVNRFSGWNQIAVDGVTAHTVPGNHYTLLRAPGVVAVADWLRMRLDEVQTRRS